MTDTTPKLSDYMERFYVDPASDELARQMTTYFTIHPDLAAEEENFVLLNTVYNRRIASETKEYLGRVLVDAHNMRVDLMRDQFEAQYKAAERQGRIN